MAVPPPHTASQPEIPLLKNVKHHPICIIHIVKKGLSLQKKGDPMIKYAKLTIIALILVPLFAEGKGDIAFCEMTLQ